MHEYCIGQDYVYAPNLISSPHRTVITFVFTSEASIYNRGMWSFLECEKMYSCVSDPSLLPAKLSESPLALRGNEIFPFIY